MRRYCQSLSLIRSCGLPPETRIVDVGGGASTLVDDLVAAGYRDVAVIDLASAALEVAKQRLGSRANAVAWIVGDVTTPRFPTTAWISGTTARSSTF